MRAGAIYTVLGASVVSSTLANVEKTIFSAPPAISIPQTRPNLNDLSLIPLTPSHLSVRTRLNASFVGDDDDASKGTEHWLLLDSLSPDRRYEVRICWLATVRQSASIFALHSDQSIC